MIRRERARGGLEKQVDKEEVKNDFEQKTMRWSKIRKTKKKRRRTGWDKDNEN